MKRLAVILLGAIGLSACVPVSVGPAPAPRPLVIDQLSYTSNFRDSAGNSYICDNKFTTLTYSFRYSDFSLLSRWDARLVGETTGQVTNTITVNKNSNEYINSGNRVTVNWVVGQGVAPLNVNPQGIVVTPIPQPKIIGRTRLELRVYHINGDSVPVQLQGIPVVDNCP